MPTASNASFADAYLEHWITCHYMPRTYLEVEMAYLKEEKDKASRRYEPVLVAKLFATRDVNHNLYSGKARDPDEDSDTYRGREALKRWKLGDKNPGQGPDLSR